MSMERRLDDLKDKSLTPREAVILWMQEAHQFGSFVDYGRWLTDQPDEAYPLIRMPEQVVGAIRAKNKGVSDTELRDQFFAVQRDLLFLYYLHSQANLRASSDHEPLSLRVIMLIREIRALTLESYGLDELRRGRTGVEAGVQKRPGKKDREAREGYRAHLERWLPEAMEVRRRICVFLMATDLLSRRYFAGHDILYPETREDLTWNLATIANLLDTYADLMRAGGQSDAQLRRYVLELAGEQVEKDMRPPSILNADPEVPALAKTLAEEWVLMAKSEALEKLGERDQAEQLAQRLMREYVGWES